MIIRSIRSNALDEAAPTNCYVALLSTLPTSDDGTGAVEVTSGGYARVQVTSWTDDHTEGKTERRNTNRLEFPALTSSMTAVGWALYTTSVGGSMLWYDSFASATQIQRKPGQTPIFAAGDLVVGIAHDA